jgi:crossover junction endodeoxyribonuclease RuvC
MFSFGKNYGTWLGIMAALKIPHQQVSPATWKKSILSDMGKEKDASRVKAMQLFPNSQRDLYLKKHHGRADALLMAEWARRVSSPGKF